MTNLNADMLRKVVNWAKGQDAALTKLLGANWYQGSWAKEVRNGVCETSYCIAGAAATLDGWKPAMFEDVTRYHSLPDDYTVHWTSDCQKDGKLELYFRAGQDALGLREDEAAWLFDGDNTIGMVIEIANDILRRHGHEPDLTLA